MSPGSHTSWRFFSFPCVKKSIMVKVQCLFYLHNWLTPLGEGSCETFHSSFIPPREPSIALTFVFFSITQ